MRTFEIEIVARAVKIYRREIDPVHAILLAISLQLDKEHFLGEAVGSVGFFGIAVPKIIFAKGNGSEFWIEQIVPAQTISRFRLRVRLRWS